MTKTQIQNQDNQQFRLIISGLINAGAVSKYVRQQAPFLRRGELHCKVGKHYFIIGHYCYNEESNVWRVYVYPPDRSNHEHEFTYHASEIAESIGTGLYSVLLGKTNKKIPAWPLFAGDAYPQYAWTANATHAQLAIA